MKNRALAATAAAALIGSLTLTACGQGVSNSSVNNGKNAAQITNCGKAHTYPADPQRIVALNPGQGDLIARLGAADRVTAIAQTNGAPIPTSLTANGHKPTVLSDSAPPTKEQLLGTQPQLVLSPTTYEFTAEKGYATEDQLRQAGAEVYIAAAGCLDRRGKADVTDLLTDIDALGKILGKDKEAQELHNKAQGILTAATERAKDQTKPKVAQLFIEGDTISAIGGGVEHSMVAAAGGDNVFNPDDPAFAKFFAAEISRETLVDKNPEVIVFSSTGKDHEKRTREWLTKNFANVEAVKNDRIVALPAAELLPGTWGNLDAVTSMNEAFYPAK
ncbi:corrinoid ABC transporter substrate-binding protein [Dermatophilus congolensis]|uniref:Corrinoid ABC transporter substrate-binding protein n=1 Tax=Dermatophilus congolensis TaxID=1863 RepID=A0AA46BLE7_9MICO|nr:ABC transporter substrate-binding protein [Dermatophilus congolensis]STD03891.1 corrinoid ABC transporter substrate-binding protein [Dermatophilus congolensis]